MKVVYSRWQMLLLEQTPEESAAGIPWCHSPYFEQLLRRRALTQEQRDLAIRYNRDGYVVIDLDLPESLMVAVVKIMQGLTSALDAWQHHQPIKELALFPQLLDTIRFLYGGEPLPFQTLNYYKSPQQGIHSDMLHFNSFPMRYMCAAWIALEDVTETTGPLFYYPGSHQLPFYDFSDVGLKVTTERGGFHDNLGKYTQWLQHYVNGQGLERKLFTCQRGQILIWSSNLLHGSIKVAAVGSTRASQVNHYFFHGCDYYTPAYSNLGSIHYREPIDIATGLKHNLHLTKRR